MDFTWTAVPNLTGTGTVATQQRDIGRARGGPANVGTTQGTKRYIKVRLMRAILPNRENFQEGETSKTRRRPGKVDRSKQVSMRDKC